MVAGIVLILIGIAGYLNGAMTGHASLTALIPAAFGLVLAVLGAAGNARPNARKHFMHAAAAVALLGFIMTAVRAVPKLGEITTSPAIMAQAAMSVVCLFFVLLAIRSFVAARRG